MKKFILKLSGFFLTGLFVVWLIYFVTTPRLKDDLLIFPPSKNILIVGDSYTACAINDSIFQRSVNMSFVAEPYLYSYIKLKKILPLNPHIDTVFVGFSSISVNCYTDMWYTDSGPISKRLPAHSQLMNFKELFSVFSTSPSGFINAYVLDLKANVKDFYQAKKSYDLKDMRLGNYVFSKKEMTKEILIEGKSMEKTMSTAYSSRQIDYLEKISEVCNEHQVKLILIVTPIHSASPKSFQNAFYSLYRSKFSHIDMQDYSKFVLPDSCFGDLHHLNYRGARIFSGYLESL